MGSLLPKEVITKIAGFADERFDKFSYLTLYLHVGAREHVIDYRERRRVFFEIELLRIVPVRGNFLFFNPSLYCWRECPWWGPGWCLPDLYDYYEVDYLDNPMEDELVMMYSLPVGRYECCCRAHCRCEECLFCNMCDCSYYTDDS